jgi:hypothetical protein
VFGWIKINIDVALLPTRMPRGVGSSGHETRWPICDHVAGMRENIFSDEREFLLNFRRHGTWARPLSLELSPGHSCYLIAYASYVSLLLLEMNFVE